MTIRRVEDLGTQIGSLLVLGATSGLTDGQLLDRFATGEESASSLAFEILVERHGSMVFRVCRQVLGDRHDAQDAFQATFLVLVRKARSIRDRGSVASWLHGVALRVASHAKATKARRRRLDREKAQRLALDPRAEPADDLGSRLHEEIGRLPEPYRAAVVLCYLEGHTCEDAARLLRWPVGTVKSRLSRAKERLRGRLTRLGLAPAIVPLSPQLAKSTAKLAARLGAGSSPSASVLEAVSLAEGALKAMTLAKLKWTVIALMMGVTGIGIGIASAMMAGSPAQEPDRKTKVEEARKPATPAPDPIALMVPRELSSKAGNGTALMYALTPNGERIQKNPEGPPGGPWNEVEVDLRWVAITGILDNQAIREAEAKARKVALSEAFPAYKRVDLQRQSRKPGGSWSNWSKLDVDKNYEVLDNLPEVDREEIVVEEIRPSSLVDPLPLLKKGTWSGVNPEHDWELWRQISERRLKPKAPNPQLKTDPIGKFQPKEVMIRSLDFTVEAGFLYRYQARIVAVNPDKAKDGKRDLLSPWSEPSTEVGVP